ncbi:MAG: uracil-DNA glycosylase [Alphaproteobacteria bacterium]|nr:uracil-DNA glycosylase [Alphaproteobacteria bacterium]
MISRIHTSAPRLDCPLCPRLAAFRAANRIAEPSWHNAPVPSFEPPADDRTKLLIVGLAPGRKGANRTGRPFTGDYAGDLLYPTLLKFGFARGRFDAREDDGLTLVGCRITNAVRCVPPENKPTPGEVKTCSGFLADEISALHDLRMILVLGTIAHNATLAILGEKRTTREFRHGARHELSSGLVLIDSYHCSRYNVNTGRLKPAMFEAVLNSIANELTRQEVRGSKSF